MPTVKALKNFRGETGEGDANNFVVRGSELTLSDERHRALARNGLVEPPEQDDKDQKKAPDPQNKMQAEPPNKNITHASMQTKRVALDDPKAAENLKTAPKLDLNDPNAAKKIVDNSRPLAGGATGAENAPSSSVPGRPQRRRMSKPPGAAPKS